MERRTEARSSTEDKETNNVEILTETTNESIDRNHKMKDDDDDDPQMLCNEIAVRGLYYWSIMSDQSVLTTGQLSMNDPVGSVSPRQKRMLIVETGSCIHLMSILTTTFGGQQRFADLLVNFWIGDETKSRN